MDEFLRSTIQTADAFVYAFTISDHYTHSSFKCYDDRQFCNGHRTVTHGTPIAYLISGDYQYESNLRMIVEGRSEVGGNYLCGVATDEGNTTADIRTLADSLVFALEKKLSRPANFYGVVGLHHALHDIDEVPEDLHAAHTVKIGRTGPHLCHAGHDEGRPQILQGAWHLRFSSEAEKAHSADEAGGGHAGCPVCAEEDEGANEPVHHRALSEGSGAGQGDAAVK